MGTHNFSAAQRRRILDRCQQMCFYCGRTLHLDSSVWEDSSPEMYLKHDLYCHLDHLEAHSKGGVKVDDNLVASCRTCNSTKGKRSVEEYRAYLEARQPHKLAAMFIQQAMDEVPSPYRAALTAIKTWHEDHARPIIFAGERLIESGVHS